MIEIDLDFKMENIPVTYELEGREYKGFLSWTPGHASFHWDLHVNNYYQGFVQYVRNYEWEFWNQKTVKKTNPSYLNWSDYSFGW